MSAPTEGIDHARLRIHFAVRGLALVGILVIVWIEFQSRYLPNLLPSPAWHPPDTLHKWLGIGIDAFDILVLLLAMFLSPLYAYLSFRASKGKTGQSQWCGDAVSVAILYLFLVVSFMLGALH